MLIMTVSHVVKNINQWDTVSAVGAIIAAIAAIIAAAISFYGIRKNTETQFKLKNKEIVTSLEREKIKEIRVKVASFVNLFNIFAHSYSDIRKVAGADKILLKKELNSYSTKFEQVYYELTLLLDKSIEDEKELSECITEWNSMLNSLIGYFEKNFDYSKEKSDEMVTTRIKLLTKTNDFVQKKYKELKKK